MPFSAPGRESRRGSRAAAPGQDASQTLEQREKTRSSQNYHNAITGGAARRGSAQPSIGTIPERPGVKSRTNSAPLVDVRATGAARAEKGVENGGGADGEGSAHESTQDTMAAAQDGQDEDEVAGILGGLRQYQAFQSGEVAELLEINIAVVGAPGVGKTTFVRKALELPSLPQSLSAERRIPMDGNEYLVRLLEVPIADVYYDDDDSVLWPDTIEDKVMPRVHGAITIYDVQDRGSFEDIPDVLNAIRKASLPSVLISSKCDTPQSQRELDPLLVERKARSSISGLGTLQTSETDSENQRKAMGMLLQQIVFGNLEEQARSSSANRRRAQSNAVRPVSPRPPSGRGHARASSEYTGGLHKDQKHARHDSSIAAYASSDRLKVPNEASHEQMHQSFLLEESGSEAASRPASNRSSASDGAHRQASGGAPAVATLSENGATFDELVDRLLAQPTSKADSKFSAIFLALYRKFAAPGRLLEAIVQRFEALDKLGEANMTKTVAQLRYLSILEQWLSQYPGDFAFPQTKRRVRTLVAKISQTRIFAIAAKEMGSHLDSVQVDDDTDWAYSDREREVHPGDNRISTGSTTSTLIDDSAYAFMEDMSGTTIGDDKSIAAGLVGETGRSVSSSSLGSSQYMTNTESAQKAAQLLQPNPRKPITKVEWRVLMEIPDDTVAKELTRMDWIMFSSIRPRDLVRQLSSAEKARCKNVANVTRMIEHFNYIAMWVVNYILLRDKPKHRAWMMEKMMRVARKLRELNNYNAVGAIIAGIKSSSVGRLTATKELIPPNMGKDWLKLEILMGHSRSHAAYRLAWENTPNERIPYLPLHLRDLATADQGNSTFTGDEGEGRVNWKKFEIMGEVVVSMQRAQGMPYKGLGGAKSDPLVKDLILDVKVERNEEALYDKSVALEPSAGAGGPSEKFKQFFKR